MSKAFQILLVENVILMLEIVQNAVLKVENRRVVLLPHRNVGHFRRMTSKYATRFGIGNLESTVLSLIAAAVGWKR
jgi:hypothetical protein